MNYYEKLWERIGESERAGEQNELLIKAVKSEKKTGFFEFMQDMLFGLGLRYVFRGVYDVLFASLAAAYGIFVLTMKFSADFSDSIYGLVFAFSPVVFFLFFILLYLKEREDGSYEMKMTCRYTVWHLCAFRMFMSGIGCLLLNTAFVATAAERTGERFAELLAVSFSSLFLFALAMIVAMLRWGTKGLFVPAAFLVLSFFGCVFDEYTVFLRNIPIAAYLIIGLGAAVLFQKKLINIDRRYSYAVR